MIKWDFAAFTAFRSVRNWTLLALKVSNPSVRSKATANYSSPLMYYILSV